MSALGPGLIMAGAAIGVSHLVQSTRAGADFGFALWWAIALACIAKYPFLQYGPRYAAATGESLIEGYRRLGRWALILFAVLTVGTMFTTLAGVTVVTAGIAGRLFGVLPDARLWGGAILGLCVVILMAGRYPALDTLMKVMMAVLSVSTLAAVVLAFTHAGESGVALPAAPTLATLPFIIALMGWMPIPIDVSVWHSLWTLERRRQTGHTPPVRDSVADFNFGYVLAFLMAFGFLSLGALLMHGTGERFADGSVAFAEQLVGLYTRTLGGASGPVIALAVLITMFSTTLAVTDAYPRVIERFLLLGDRRPRHSRRIYVASLIAVAGASYLILAMFTTRMTLLIDVATSLAFLSAPVLGWMNLRLVTGIHMPEEARPGRRLLVLSYAGLTLLIILGLAFLANIAGILRG
jgi:Mn2+/Fe2+ NRAMP family transporter